jgi:hypothetical protein
LMLSEQYEDKKQLAVECAIEKERVRMQQALLEEWHYMSARMNSCKLIVCNHSLQKRQHP